MKNKFKKVLVTGGAGCIGIQVCKELTRRGISVIMFDLPEQITRNEKFIPSNIKIYYGSILDCSSLRDSMSGCDAIIHLAAYLGVRRTEINRLRCIEININGTKNVLDCAIQHRINKILYASSSEVYGEPLKNPISEESATQGKSVYAISKLAGEEIFKAYNQRYPELSFTILRYFNTYGPFQIAQFVIPKFIMMCQNNIPPVIYGDGNQTRSYSYASDSAWATVEALLSTKADGEIINIGNSRSPITLSELAKKIIRICGKEGKLKPKYKKKFINADRTLEREIFNRFCDTKKAHQILGFTPEVSLEEGIKKVIKHGIIFPKWATTDLIYTMDEWL